MKFWHLIFVTFFANYSLRKATECVDKGKLRPSFDEIFGKGWDEKGKRQQKMDKLPWENDGQMGEENEFTIDQMSDSDKEEQQNKISDQKREDRSDQEKRVIIEKFHLVREKLNESGKLEKRKRAKIERQIGGQLEVSRSKIYKWKRELGIPKRKKCFSDQQKRAIIEKFQLIREKLKEIGQFPRRKRAKIERQIGQQLGVSRKTIYKWKKELGIKMKNCNHNHEEKKRKFIELLDKFNKEMPRKEKEEKIMEELGISGRTIRRWKKEMGLTKARRAFSDREKKEIIQKFDLIREKLKEIEQFPSIKRGKIECQIAKQLGVSRKTIYKWKKELGQREIKRKRNGPFEKQ